MRIVVVAFVIAASNHDLQAEIDTAKLKAKEASDPELAKIAAISRQVQDYADAHRGEVNRKTKPLVFGSIGWRKSTKYKLPRDPDRLADIVRLLIALGWHDCVKQTAPTINKEALRTHPVEDVVKVGVSVSVEDVFWLETAREDIPKDKE